MTTPLPRGSGWRPIAFECSFDDREVVRAALMRSYAWCVDEKSIEWRAGALHFQLDLSRFLHGDGPSMEWRIRERLQAELSTRRPNPPNEPPEEP